MNITKYLMGLGIMAAMSLTACTNDEPAAGNGNEIDGNEAFYATLSLSLPTNASRSETVPPTGDGNSSDGTIVGEDYENQIKSVLVILATRESDGQYMLQTVNQADAYSFGSNAAPTYRIKFDTKEVLRLVKENKSVYPFVICNPDALTISKMTSLSAGDKTFANDIVSLTDADNFSGWTNNNFLMTNAYINSAVTLPTESEFKNYTTSNNPFNLTQATGPIKVERTVARFDFKSTQKPGLAINTYAITDASSNTVGTVTLTGMALINEARDFYTFRHVSADGTPAGWTIGGLETPDNYMVSPYADDLSQRQFLLSGFDTTGAPVAPESMNYTSLAGMGTSYSIWRYATENAIPGINNQKKGITTGVVFKGQINFVDATLAAVATAGKPIYKFENTIYAGIAGLEAEIRSNPNTFMAAKAKQAGLYEVDATGAIINFRTDEDNFNTAAGPQMSKAGFTMFRADANGDYNVYYYYWNRHNDNNDPNVMGKMEFGVVRNNVYRLAVNNIYTFGHPGTPTDDPDPDEPGQPDETSNLYIALDVQVLPWVVRINDIEF